jgi:hypothetical protein
MPILQQILEKPPVEDLFISMAVGGVAGILHTPTLGNLTVGVFVGTVGCLSRIDLEKDRGNDEFRNRAILSIALTVFGLMSHDMCLRRTAPLFSTNIWALTTLGTVNIIGQLFLIYHPSFFQDPAPSSVKSSNSASIQVSAAHPTTLQSNQKPTLPSTPNVQPSRLDSPPTTNPQQESSIPTQVSAAHPAILQPNQKPTLPSTPNVQSSRLDSPPTTNPQQESSIPTQVSAAHPTTLQASQKPTPSSIPNFQPPRPENSTSNIGFPQTIEEIENLTEHQIASVLQSWKTGFNSRTIDEPLQLAFYKKDPRLAYYIVRQGTLKQDYRNLSSNAKDAVAICFTRDLTYDLTLPVSSKIRPPEHSSMLVQTLVTPISAPPLELVNSISTLYHAQPDLWNDLSGQMQLTLHQKRSDEAISLPEITSCNLAALGTDELLYCYENITKLNATLQRKALQYFFDMQWEPTQNLIHAWLELTHQDSSHKVHELSSKTDFYLNRCSPTQKRWLTEISSLANSSEWETFPISFQIFLQSENPELKDRSLTLGRQPLSTAISMFDHRFREETIISRMHSLFSSTKPSPWAALCLYDQIWFCRQAKVDLNHPLYPLSMTEETYARFSQLATKANHPYPQSKREFHDLMGYLKFQIEADPTLYNKWGVEVQNLLAPDLENWKRN